MSTLAEVQLLDEIDGSTFDRFRRLIYRTCGISLGEHKEAMFRGRAGKRMRALGIRDYRQYLRVVEENPAEVSHLVDVVSTNVTRFFRESAHFEYLDSALARWRAEGRHRLRIWSAACSTGEEPLSIAMVAQRHLDPTVDLRILATDISTRALDRCRDGIYRDKQLADLPEALRRRYFRAVAHGGKAELWQIDPALQRDIVFTRLNLAAPPFPMKGPFDAVFCRNVMIYFDDAVRRRLLAEIDRLLRPGGLLFVGHAESLTGMLSPLRSVRPSVYEKP